jgi:hypothetical protein
MADSIEVRLARLEGSYEQIDKRLGAIEGRLDRLEVELHEGLSGLRSEMHRGFDRMRSEMHENLSGLENRLRKEAQTRFYWLLGLIVLGLIIPIVLAVL